MRDGQRQGECTAFAVVPEASASGHTLIGQNWDWLLHCFDTVVVLEAEQDEGPNYVSVVEAGLLAKTGMNSSGLGVATNALVTEDDRGEPAMPYHVLLRAFMDCETISDALSAAQRSRRSSSANYLLAHRRRHGRRHRGGARRLLPPVPAVPRRRRAAAHEPLPVAGVRPPRRLAVGDAGQPVPSRAPARRGRRAVRPSSRSTRSARRWPTTRTTRRGSVAIPTSAWSRTIRARRSRRC